MTDPSTRSAGRVESAPDRLAWVDIAKSIAIVLVVLYHVGTNGMAWLMPQVEASGIAVWQAVNDTLVPLRMPLFFVVSGLLATGAMTRPWPQLLRPRIAALLWPFAIWTLLFAAPYALYRGDVTVVDSLARAAWSIPLGGTGYWYLFVFVIFFVVSRALYRFGPVLLLVAVVLYAAAPAIGLAVASVIPSPVGDVVTDTMMRLCTFFLWYAIGCFAPGIVARVAESDAWMLALATAAYAALTALQLTGAGPSGARSLALSITGIAVALIGSRLLGQWEPVRRLGRYLAARTLAIYVVHPFALAIVIWVTLRFSDGTGVPLVLGAEWWLTPVLTIALVALSCLAYDVAMRSPLRYVFVPPSYSDAKATIRRL
ncbi:MAG: acyltransferase [Microcella sp.]|nr:acyltransferase [Microcella sp.]